MQFLNNNVIGPIFFDKTMDCDVYMKIIQDFIALLEKDEWYAWFQQIPSHCSLGRKKMVLSAQFFEDRIISTGRWLARSQDLTLPNFILRVYLKNNVYRNKPSAVRELKTKIKFQIRAIDENTCKCVLENMIRKLMCVGKLGRGHFQHRL